MSQQLLYCRFCAEQKSGTEIIDLTSNIKTRKLVIKNMLACNISCVDFCNKDLSETICMSCLNTLNVLIEFLNKVRLSQVILSDVCKVYKTEYYELPESTFKEDCCEFDPENAMRKDENTSSTIKVDVNVSVETIECVIDENSNCFDTSLRSFVNESFNTIGNDANVSWMSYPWSCIHCHITLESVEDVREHSRKIHRVCYGFRCADCDLVQNEFELFVNHVREHRDELKHVCAYCNLKLEDSSEYMHTHNNKCRYCGDMFPDAESLNKHLSKYASNLGNVKDKISKPKILALKELLCNGVEIYEPNYSESWKDYPWVCKYCNTKFPDQNVLRNHAREVHGKCFGFKCIDCAKTSEGFGSFIEHVRAHRPNLMYYCQYCNCRIEDTKTDIVHMSGHLSNNLRCQTCGHIFKNDVDLQKHISVYNPPKLKRLFKRRHGLTADDLTCNICQKVSKNVSILRAHKKLHTDRQRDYTCDRCGMAFFTKGALSAHKLIHENPEPQICLICKKSFLTLTRLKKHLKTHNGVKPFKCTECQRCFRLKDQLKGHLITHTDLLPFQCQYCEKAFKHKNVLKIHENQHTGARPYSCVLCNMDFANWSNCNKHMKRKHGTTLAKNVLTPQGKVPLNPKTGKPRQLRDFETIKKWAETILKPCKRGKKSS